MTRKYFGTDGIRGKANQFPMTADMALKVAMAAGLALQQSDSSDGTRRRAVIGKDTRLSGYMLEQAMAAGFEALGIDVIFLGPIPTPAVAMLTRSLRADIGVMISASHNPYEDNGIKLFGADGFKLSDEVETQIETYIDSDLSSELPSPSRLGKASRLDDATGRYVEFLKASLPRRQTLEGLKIVLDCANGAAYKVAPQVLWELEAEVITINNTPNGRNINHECGATHTDGLQKRVVEEGADVGIALDGDADRLIMVDETGRQIDGDQLMAPLAVNMDADSHLMERTLVSTVMSNLGLERFITGQGMTLLRTPVGDRYVVEQMREGSFNLGGEQSGHIVLADYGRTGDGLLAALQILTILKQKGGKASDTLHLFDPLPQILKNVRVSGDVKPLDKAEVQEALLRAHETLSNDGRLLVRASGTEPLIRVMAEGDDLQLIERVVDDLCALIAEAGQ